MLDSGWLKAKEGFNSCPAYINALVKRLYGLVWGWVGVGLSVLWLFLFLFLFLWILYFNLVIVLYNLLWHIFRYRDLVLFWFGLFFAKCVLDSFIGRVAIGPGLLITPKLFFIHCLYNAGYSFSQLLDPLLDFSWVLIKLLIQRQFNPIDTTLNTGVDFLLYFLINISFFPTLLKYVPLVEFKAIDQNLILYLLIKLSSDLFHIVLRIGLEKYWRL